MAATCFNSGIVNSGCNEDAVPDVVGRAGAVGDDAA
jgi:hypothetical protein